MAAINGGGGGGGGGGGQPFMTDNYKLIEEEEDDDELFEKNNNRKHRMISIAERRAKKCGFNASNINVGRFRSTTVGPVSPNCFTIPPGISPSALLDSPIMLPNAQAQQSPTTGTFEFPSPDHDGLKLKLKHASITKAHSESALAPNNLRVQNELSSQTYEQPFEGFGHLQEMTKKDSCFEEDALAKSKEPSNSNGNHNDQSPNQEKHHQKGKEVAKYSDDGFYWRKYGQKHVKGSEFPRSYYKCTTTNCPVKKKVERSHDGQITEIVYKGSHNHPVPQAFKLFSENSEMREGSASCFGTDWKPADCLDGTISTSFPSDFSDPISRPINTFEPVEAQFSSTFGSQDGDGQNEASPESISLNDEDDENGDLCEIKRRKRDGFPIEATASRSTRQPRVVVQIESKIDILEDGYRWRKYGQKVVKGNPNPRSYYKCTTPGCPVRKHVERAANDIKSVVTTYEGKHNHEVPTSKNGSLVISDVPNLSPAVNNSTISIPSTMAQKLDVQKAGNQVQDLPLYLDRKPIFSYNEFMRSNFPGSFVNDVNFGASSVYPFSFPFQSLPPYGSLLTNNYHMKNYPSSHLYPMLPDHMPLPSQINHVPESANVTPLGGNFLFNTYSAIQKTSTRGQEMEIGDHHTKTVKSKEEMRDDGDELSIPIHGNRTT